MRFVALLLAVSPSFAFADRIEARIKPTDVIVYPLGASVQRAGTVQLPAGVHTLVLPDLLHDLDPEHIEVSVGGATVISTEWRDQTPGPYDFPDTPEFNAAKAALEAAEAALQAKQDQISEAELGRTAAQAQITFLAQLSSSDTLPDGVDSLRDLSRMIAEETLAAQRAAHDATLQARDLQRDLPDLKDAVERAELAYEGQLPPDDNPAQMTLTLDVPSAVNSPITVKYLTGKAKWQPTYDMRLTTGDDASLQVKRGASVVQTTGERWEDVNLTLSTVLPFGQSDPRTLHPSLLRILDAEKMHKQRAVSSMADSAGVAEPVLEAPVIIEESAALGLVDLTGIAATYRFDYAISVDSSFYQAPVDLALGDLTFDAKVSAQAVPRHDETAFRMVAFTNTSDERLLPSSSVSLFVDDVLVSDTEIEGLVPGADTKIGFGPLHGLRLTRTVLDRNEGDRGIISRSNEKTEEVRIDIDNFTGEDWNVTLLDRVPYTEQEDLSITWSAAPRPTDENFEDRRGILHWDLDMGAGEKRSITINTKIQWPEGMILR